ncbi:MAG: hypothetical protein M3O15_12160 [Acidobacteriota bacterium]|nr:hypothetical protein [Acidobacteriota bacterium]
MRSRPEAGSSSPRNAFTDEFLGRLDTRTEPESASEADHAGPWAVQAFSREGRESFAVLRAWESLDRGDRPFAVFSRRETALLAAAVLPGTGRDPHFRLGNEPEPHGFPVTSGGGVEGHLQEFDERLVDALHVAAALVRSPEALAKLLEAAGFVALEKAGRILTRKVH